MAEETRRTTQSWLTAAVAGIRFQPDRAAVERELREHIEDKTADLQRLYPDLTREEVEQMALGRMGDPEEIGRELARVHRPWLGWLWRASQCLLAGVLTALVVLMGMTIKDTWEIWGLVGGYQGVLERVEQATQGWTAVAQVPESEHIKIGDFTAFVPRGALWETETGERDLYLMVRISSPRFWERAWPEKNGITLTDSLGNRYELGWKTNGDGSVTQDYNQARTGLFHTDCVLILRNFAPAAQWARLDYEYLGQGFTLTAQLEEVEQE